MRLRAVLPCRGRHGKQAGYPIKWYDSAEGLLADAEVDCVYIATPPGSHLELARQAASARKAVYVEKPMARTAAECTEMVALFESMDLPLFCGWVLLGCCIRVASPAPVRSQ